jgi:CO/xanthine dehydrogenase Mo-binding subunit
LAIEKSFQCIDPLHLEPPPLTASVSRNNPRAAWRRPGSPVVLASVPHRKLSDDENETVKRTKSSHSACALEITVAEETGIVSAEKTCITHDVGKAINPLRR